VATDIFYEYLHLFGAAQRTAVYCSSGFINFVILRNRLHQPGYLRLAQRNGVQLRFIQAIDGAAKDRSLSTSGGDRSLGELVLEPSAGIAFGFKIYGLGLPIDPNRFNGF
jgi:hypothetical protein